VSFVEVHLKFNYGYENSLELLKKVERDESKLYDAVVSQCPERIADSIFDFSVTAYHLKDWLKEDGFINVESYINSEPMLRLCADLCNGSKHRILTKNREKSDKVLSINNSDLTVDMTSITIDSTIPINGHTVRVLLSSGKEIEILHFAKSVLDLWRKYISTPNKKINKDT
jgi:hypothetical protein